MSKQKKKRKRDRKFETALEVSFRKLAKIWKEDLPVDVKLARTAGLFPTGERYRLALVLNMVK